METQVSSAVASVQKVLHGFHPMPILLSSTVARELTLILQHSLSIGMYEYRAGGCMLFGEQRWQELMVFFFFKAPPDILRLIGCCLGVASSAEDAVLLSIMACLSFGRVDREVFVCGSQLVRVCDRKV